MSVAELTGSEARWEEGNGKTDYVGPNFGATWGGTTEERKISERIGADAGGTGRRPRGE